MEYFRDIKNSSAFSYEKFTGKILILVIFPYSINHAFTENYLNLHK